MNRELEFEQARVHVYVCKRCGVDSKSYSPWLPLGWVAIEACVADPRGEYIWRAVYCNRCRPVEIDRTPFDKVTP